jgi:acyl dehydratase
MGVRIADLSVGQRLPERTFEVARADVLRYAAASGDFNPLHHDGAAAKAAGMQGAFAHGMFSAGCLATALTDALGVQSLTRLAVRFRAQAWLGTTVTSEIVVAGVREESERVIVDLQCTLRSAEAVIVSGAAGAASGLADDPDDSAPPTRAGLTGQRLAPAVVSVERGPVQFFALAVGDNNPVYRSARAAAAWGASGIPVPPTFIFSAAHWGAFDDLQPPAPNDSATLIELIAQLRNGRKGVVLHGEQEFTYHSPVYVGETLGVDGYVESVEEKPACDGRPGMTVMVVRTNYRNASARLVTSARATFLFRPATRG